jgi:uncharacterized membrane protein
MVITGILSTISTFLGLTRLGFIPWINGASLTLMQVPVIIGAVLRGPVVGGVIGLLFGIFNLIQAAVAPTGPADVWFTNPFLSVVLRLFIGPVAWLIYSSEDPGVDRSGPDHLPVKYQMWPAKGR